MTLEGPARRLLVLDDEPAVGQTVALIAQAAGLEVRATVSAEEFFRELTPFAPTHIVLDLVMPGLDGVEVIRQLGERGCRARLIISSGVGSRVLDAARRSAAEHGLDIAGVLPKPFLPAALRALLDTPGPLPAAARPAAASGFEPAEADLHLALARRELRVYYEPQVSCADGALAGFEALVRWHHPQAGVIAPECFIGLAESCGLIDALTEQVIEESFAWIAHSHRGSSWSLSVNLSPKSLGQLDLADRLLARSRAYAIAPERLILEVTETSAMDKPTTTLDLLTRLRMKGFQVSIDDFGSGYSSMVQLVRLPFSEMKIDKAFVMSALQSHESRAVVRATIELGHALGLRVIAEGTEDAPTLAFLREHGCDLAQGYHFARAMPADAVASWLAQRAAEAVG